MSSTDQKRLALNERFLMSDASQDKLFDAATICIQTDSNYYLGYLFEGQYKKNKAADIIGYKQAINSLTKAHEKILKDYKYALTQVESNTSRTVQLSQYYYYNISFYLVECYMIVDDYENAVKLLNERKEFLSQQKYIPDYYNKMSWIVHLNRLKTNKDYSFLKNSIADNEQLAMQYTDKAIDYIDQHPPNEGRDMKPYVYHYKALLYTYNLQIDSAAKYYELMNNRGLISNNNYGTFFAIQGNFKEAEKNYEYAEGYEGTDQDLKEYKYYRSIIDIYRGIPEAGIESLKQTIKEAGARPGYGWYNIALARSYMYKGMIDSAHYYLDIAANFKELHIGTTLGAAQYQFSIDLLDYNLDIKAMDMTKFEHTNWWYHPKYLLKMAQLYINSKLKQYKLVNYLMSSQERETVLYRLFASESTVSWDELSVLFSNINNKYFLKYFQQVQNVDQRPKIKKYFQLMEANLLIKKGDIATAKTLLTEILATSENIDGNYEKLFLARVYEALADVADEEENKSQTLMTMNEMFVSYPQLIPFTNQKVSLKLNLSGDSDVKKVKEGLGNYKINWLPQDAEANVNQVYITISKSNMTVQVTGYDGIEIQSIITFNRTKDIDKDIHQVIDQIFLVQSFNADTHVQN